MNHRKKTVWIIVLIVCLIALGIGAGVFAWYWMGGTPPTPVNTTPTVPTTDSTVPTTTTTQPLPPNPIDFAAWQQTNPDVYAWLTVPGTNIDYPVVCPSDEADDFYLHHNVYKDYEFAGTIYSEKANGRELADRNTVMYGHNMLNGTMFRTLHDFEDETFFNEHDVFYLYTPGHIYTYTIFAAYEFDNRHLLNCFDYTDDTVWAEYLENAKNPKSMNVHTRDVEVTTADRIVTLSTCVGTNKSARYLVQGVLTNDQPTA